jgi:hypothetical protein
LGIEERKSEVAVLSRFFGILFRRRGNGAIGPQQVGSPTDCSLPHDITTLEETVEGVEREEREVREIAGGRLMRLNRDQLAELNAKEVRHKTVVSRLLKKERLFEALQILEQRADDRFHQKMIGVTSGGPVAQIIFSTTKR